MEDKTFIQGYIEILHDRCSVRSEILRQSQQREVSAVCSADGQDSPQKESFELGLKGQMGFGLRQEQREFQESE